MWPPHVPCGGAPLSRAHLCNMHIHIQMKRFLNLPAFSYWYCIFMFTLSSDLEQWNLRAEWVCSLVPLRKGRQWGEVWRDMVGTGNTSSQLCGHSPFSVESHHWGAGVSQGPPWIPQLTERVGHSNCQLGGCVFWAAHMQVVVLRDESTGHGGREFLPRMEKPEFEAVSIQDWILPCKPCSLLEHDVLLNANILGHSKADRSGCFIIAVEMVLGQASK